MTIKKYIFVLLAVALLSGCEGWLDRQPDEALTPELQFKKRATTMQYLATVYSQQPDYFSPKSDTNPWDCASDEYTEAFVYYRCWANFMTHEEWSIGMNTYMNLSYELPYRGIREATYFMQHVGECEELTETEVKWMYNEAKFMRAYYYYYMLRIYGPVFMLGEDMAGLDSGDRERDTWDDCVDWVCSQLDQAAENLPLEWDDPASNWGRATKGAALAVKAKLLIFSASPLCNGNPMYSGLVTASGKHLFPQEYDENKWVKAAEACKAVIDLKHYGLVGLVGEDLSMKFDASKAIENLKNVFCTISNEELIWVRVGSMGNNRRLTLPASIQNVSGKGYGGISPTQKLVDAFACENGYYPITGYAKNGKDPIIDSRANYTEYGFSSFTHPYFGDTAETYNMFVGREPRFYVNILWSGRKWYHGSRVEDPIQLYSTGKDGEKTVGQDAPQSGYVAYKYHDKSIDLTRTWGNGSYPIIRYADILLCYAEALNEYDPTHPDILKYLNLVRVRAGVPKIGNGGVYAECEGDQERMRELICRERNVELCFEQQRYFDCRRWMTASEEFSGWFYGMNTLALNDSPGGEFWQRAKIVKDNGQNDKERQFKDRSYFFPIPYNEAVIVKGFTQNYGWY